MDLSTTIHLLGETLGDVLRTQESVALFEVEERIRTLAKTRRVLVGFDLLVPQKTHKGSCRAAGSLGSFCPTDSDSTTC